MNNINFPFFLSTILVSILLISCGEDENDLIPPQLSVLNSSPMPNTEVICGQTEENSYKIVSNDTLKLRLLIEDNERLSQLKLDIHNNFDCHGHGGGQAPGFDPPDVSSQTEDWSLVDITDLEGKSEEILVSLPVPVNVTRGIYHLGIHAIDASGNESEDVIYDLKVLNNADTMPPQIAMEEPQIMQIQLVKGEQITFSGEVQDNRALDIGGNAIVYLTYENEATEDHYTGPYSVFQSGTGKNGPFSINFSMPQSAAEGNYKLYVQAHDGVRNIADAIVYDIQLSN